MKSAVQHMFFLEVARLESYLAPALMLVLAVAITACAPTDVDGPTGRLKIDGSSTVYPVAEAVAEDFMLEYPGVRITVGVSGTGGGFSQFLRGETDINNASRPIKPVELALARENGIEFIEIPIAYDGLTVTTHPSNDFVDCLTVDELFEIWKPGSEIDNWNQVRDEFPDQRLNLYGRSTDSGTYDYFTLAITGEEGSSRTNYTMSVDDNVVVQGVAGDRNSLGFFGLSYYENNRDRLRLLGVDDENPETGDGCVKPTAETVQDGTYQPLSRPEFIYVRADHADNDAVTAFVHFFLDNADRLVREVEYVPLSPEAYELARQRFDQHITGSVYEELGVRVGVRMADLLEEAREHRGLEDAPAPDTTNAGSGNESAPPPSEDS